MSAAPFLPVCLAAGVMLAGCAPVPASRPAPEDADTVPGLPPTFVERLKAGQPVFTVAAVALLPTGMRGPGLDGQELGGLSGCTDASTARTRVIVDDRRLPRIVSFALAVSGGNLTASPTGTVAVLRSGEPRARFDLEGIALLPGGEIAVAAEGEWDRGLRSDPAVLALDARARLTAELPVPEKFRADLTGRRGVRGNQAFESLTLTPAGDALWTANEGPLLQDDDAPEFDRPTRVRLLEIPRQAAREWRNGREFVYSLAPVSLPAGFGDSLLSTGLVELIALDDHTLIAMERSFIVERGDRRRRLNRIELFRIDFSGADDVSHDESLRRRPGVREVTKQHLLSLDSLSASLPARLALLENFEGLCAGPTLEDGAPSLLLVSDNNFSAQQVTAFVLLRVSATPVTTR